MLCVVLLWCVGAGVLRGLHGHQPRAIHTQPATATHTIRRTVSLLRIIDCRERSIFCSTVERGLLIQAVALSASIIHLASFVACVAAVCCGLQSWRCERCVVEAYGVWALVGAAVVQEEARTDPIHRLLTASQTGTAAHRHIYIIRYIHISISFIGLE